MYDNNYLGFEKPIIEIKKQLETLSMSDRDHSDLVKSLRNELTKMTRKIYRNLTPWETVQVARHPKRPVASDYLSLMVRDFVELHGDKNFGDDKAIVTGLGRIANLKCMFISNRKGKTTEERIANNFGMAHPEGYRKSLQKIKFAEKFDIPIVCLVDTMGAYPGIESEERGIASAIANNLMEIARVKVPIVCVNIGEGGSGGALAIGVGDRVAMLEHSYYSVISPEGCSSIIWKDDKHLEEAANSLCLTAKHAKKFKLIHEIIKEPLGGAHRDPTLTAQRVEKYIVENIQQLRRFKPDNLVKRRYKYLRNLGQFFEEKRPTKKPIKKLLTV